MPPNLTQISPANRVILDGFTNYLNNERRYSPLQQKVTLEIF